MQPVPARCPGFKGEPGSDCANLSKFPKPTRFIQTTAVSEQSGGRWIRRGKLEVTYCGTLKKKLRSDTPLLHPLPPPRVPFRETGENNWRILNEELWTLGTHSSLSEMKRWAEGLWDGRRTGTPGAAGAYLGPDAQVGVGDELGSLVLSVVRLEEDVQHAHRHAGERHEVGEGPPQAGCGARTAEAGGGRPRLPPLPQGLGPRSRPPPPAAAARRRRPRPRT